MITEELKAFIQENQEEVKKLLWILCEIPAPSHHEERRAAFIKDWLEKQGYGTHGCPRRGGQNVFPGCWR